MLENKININRFEIVSLLDGNSNIGVELGVAEGEYSIEILKSNKFKKFYGIDSYSEFQHNNKEYEQTKKKLSVFKNYHLIRKTFEDSLIMFKNDSLDFIYIDGFAHTGNNGGKTLFDWIDKVKIGGICAGDDYHDNWPLVKKTVQYYTKNLDIKLYITDNNAKGKYSDYPSWYFFKENNIKKIIPQKFYIEGLAKHKEEIINRRFYNRLKIKYLLYSLVKYLLPNKIFAYFLTIYKKFK